MKKIFIFALCCILLLSATACEQKKEPSKSITLLCCDGYIPQSVIEDFTKQTGIAVKMKYASDDEDVGTQFRANPTAYDVVIAGDKIIDELRLGNFLAPLNYKQLPNYSQVDENCKSFYFDPHNRYAIPLNLGAVLITYDTARVENEITAFEDLLIKPEYAGTTTYIDSSEVMVGICNLLLNQAPDHASEPLDIANYLNTLVTSACASGFTPQDALLNGTASVGVMFNTQIGDAIAENNNLKVVYPEEGFILAVDAIAVSSKTEAGDTAHTLINYLLEPKNNAKLMQEMELKGSTTIPEARKHMDKAFRENEGYNPDLTKLSEGQFCTPQVDKTANEFQAYYDKYFYNKIPELPEPAEE